MYSTELSNPCQYYNNNDIKYIGKWCILISFNGVYITGPFLELNLLNWTTYSPVLSVNCVIDRKKKHAQSLRIFQVLDGNHRLGIFKRWTVYAIRFNWNGSDKLLRCYGMGRIIMLTEYDNLHYAILWGYWIMWRWDGYWSVIPYGMSGLSRLSIYWCNFGWCLRCNLKWD